MTKEQETAKVLIEEFKRLMHGMFPKRCQCCGREFKDLDEFLAKTVPIPDGVSILASIEHEDTSVIDINRNCSCGSTLMVVASERRDTSPQGKDFRQKFGEAVKRLENNGVDGEKARKELLDMLHNNLKEDDSEIR